MQGRSAHSFGVFPKGGVLSARVSGGDFVTESERKLENVGDAVRRHARNNGALYPGRDSAFLFLSPR